MNLTNFVQTGGFPLKGERLQEMQSAYFILNALGQIAGNFTIISGCNITGTSVSDGFVYINGELLFFRGGFISATVIIIEEESAKEFENGELKAVHFERYVTFGTATTSWNWSSFVRPVETKALAGIHQGYDATIVNLQAQINLLAKKTAVFQAGGGMIFWNKPLAEIPIGWAEVVNWRGRMPVGWDSTQTEFDTLGEVGGAKNKSLSVGELPSHSFHILSDHVSSAPGNTEIPTPESFINRSTNAVGNLNYELKGDPTHPAPTLGKTNSVGGNQSFSMLNPYRVVLFIEYIG